MARLAGRPQLICTLSFAFGMYIHMSKCHFVELWPWTRILACIGSGAMGRNSCSRQSFFATISKQFLSWAGMSTHFLCIFCDHRSQLAPWSLNSTYSITIFLRQRWPLDASSLAGRNCVGGEKSKEIYIWYWVDVPKRSHWKIANTCQIFCIISAGNPWR